jgi:hypothetical protein
VTAFEAPWYPEYEGLRAMAEESVRLDHGFVDPVKLRWRQRLGRGWDWEVSVIGDGAQESLIDLHMLLIAHGQNLNPPLPPRVARVRAEQEAAARAHEAARVARAKARDDAWRSIWSRLPQRIEVAYNYSGGLHLENYVSGADHIILTEDLVIGRSKRVKGWAMCTTPSAVRHQWFGEGDPPEKRTATCKACLRMAARLLGVEVPPVLLARWK